MKELISFILNCLRGSHLGSVQSMEKARNPQADIDIILFSESLSNLINNWSKLDELNLGSSVIYSYSI